MPFDPFRDHMGSVYMYMCMYVCIHVCWWLHSNQNFKGPYLEAEVVEEVMGWLG